LKLSPRLSAVGVLVAAALVASCTTSGTPVAEKTTAASGSSASATAAPPVTPTAKSDEDQVRDTIYAFQDAFNTQNWDAYMQLLCNAMREQFTGPAMDMLKKGRANQGLTQVISVKVKIDGDEATATMDAQNEVLGRQNVDVPLVREDGWKICKLA
jgi:hypothetical protein